MAIHASEIAIEDKMVYDSECMGCEIVTCIFVKRGTGHVLSKLEL